MSVSAQSEGPGLAVREGLWEGAWVGVVGDGVSAGVGGGQSAQMETGV